jgi:hypothetical protein
MQYKQAPRILGEIIDSAGLATDIKLAALRLYVRCRSLPRLGPYRKRSPEQVLWRMASDTGLGGVERWEAFRQLLRKQGQPAEKRSAPVRDSSVEEPEETRRGGKALGVGERRSDNPQVVVDKVK